LGRQISANLLRDEELVDLIAGRGRQLDLHRNGIHRSGQPCDVKKGFNKPGEYAVVLDRLARRNVFAITSFIFGMDNDTPGVSGANSEGNSQLASGAAYLWLDDPLPATPLTKAWKPRAAHPLEHLARVHSLAMAHTPLKMSIDEAHNEVRIGWANSYSPEAIEKRWIH